MEWIRDTRYWWGPTYSVEIGNIFLYCGGRKSQSDITFAAYRMDRPHKAFFEVPFHTMFEGGQYVSIEEAERAAEDWFHTYETEEQDELCPECFTRHKPHENDLCQL